MKMMIKTITFFVLSLLIVNAAVAEKYRGEGTNKKASGQNLRTGAAGCLPGKSYTDLAFNNVRARINTGGDMWWNLQGIAQYEVPKGSSKTSMYSASLWMGGLDVNGQLKGAFQRYRSNGNDFWPGPLSTDGTAAVNSQTCAEYDKHYVIKRSQVDEFLLKFNNPDYPEYTVPEIIKNWPAHGDPLGQHQSYYLAPFVDVNDDGKYDYEDGDYPYYDIDNSLCKSGAITKETETGITKGGILSDQVLKGDYTIWWVFNDNGNVHTESRGNSIGVEIRAQAFSFSTNDEINNMTFYTYEIINRSTFRLTETYFSQWVDTDLGYANDDYVGCDVKRGLGYCYNGTAKDGLGKQDHYGDQPPAVGVDFFQGPYMDKDGLDNPKFVNGVQKCDESVNGVNFGDGIVDNERFGMRRFVYHNNTGGNVNLTDPDLAPDYYNFLRGIWKDGTKMHYGGNAHYSGGGNGPECDFMFPGDTDPCNWGTGGASTTGIGLWTEETAHNTPSDRRFMQSAGPFTLEPGAVNYITVGIPWARATSGGPFASVKLLQTVDDKCQALFDNCFKVLDGPDAPTLTIQELDKQIIIYLSNIKTSNNYNEGYTEEDVTISALNADSVPAKSRYDSLYRFQGYQIFQLANNEVSIADIYDLDKARLVAQCDIKDKVDQIVNFTYNDKISANIPQVMVEGGNNGIRHSFTINEDKFASGATALVNHKKYYYVAIAYSYNNYLQYSQDPGNLGGLNGQKKPYLAGRKSATGPITVATAIPHISAPEAGGTSLRANYGNGPRIKRLDGQGNGGNQLELTKETISKILEFGKADTIEYEAGFGPVAIKVIDPLNVKPGTYILKFDSTFMVKNEKVTGKTVDANGDTASYLSGKWVLIDTKDNSSTPSEMFIHKGNEQLFMDLGISITLNSVYNTGIFKVGEYTNANLAKDQIWVALADKGGYISSELVYQDSSRMWLSGVPDVDGNTGAPELNWIRSGSLDDKNTAANSDYEPSKWYDEGENYEKIVGGTWAPYRLASKYEHGPAGLSNTHNSFDLLQLQSVNIVFTSDKSKWTRCPVIETGDDATSSEGGRAKLYMRYGQSINKEGQFSASGSGPSSDPNAPNYIGERGMGWFPGYAINVETGERLNMMYGESSWLLGENGRDMQFNPTSSFYTNIGQVLFGGKHFVYIFTTSSNMPAYDAGQTAYNVLYNGGNYAPDIFSIAPLYKNVMYCGIPMASSTSSWLSNDATVKIRVSKPYANFKFRTGSAGQGASPNNSLPMYQFNLDAMATQTAVNPVAKEALSIINAVPNPYYAYSSYETDQLDNRIRITNLPENCTISIYATNGTLIRKLTKDNNLTYLDWDLKNQASIPIASGIYYFHINAPGIGEKVIKWFGVMRPIDLNAF